MLHSTSPQHQSHFSTPLVADLSDQMVKPSGIRPGQKHSVPWRHGAEREKRRKRGRGWLTGYRKVGQRSSQQGRSSRTQSGIKCILMCERIVLVLRQTDLGAKKKNSHHMLEPPHHKSCCSGVKSKHPQWERWALDPKRAAQILDGGDV